MIFSKAMAKKPFYYHINLNSAPKPSWGTGVGHMIAVLSIKLYQVPCMEKPVATLYVVTSKLAIIKTSFNCVASNHCWYDFYI
jgi:hypothetical protein